MGHGERKKFDNPAVEWIDSRLPVFTLMQREYGVFPTPRNFNYFWNFGAIAMVMLVTMIVTGITLAMHYNPSTAGAFDSVERIMRDVNHGWLIRYLHMNGASFFFIAVYIHIYRGLYYGSYKQPRELLWILGIVIFLLMMATAFMGYVLPWGQMSFWGATVITNLFSAIPLVGDSIVTLLWGGFSVDNPTLNRFFALHYLLPFVIFGVVFLHIWALHVTGSNNPLGIDAKGPQDTVPFHPYYTIKDAFGLLVFLMIYVGFTFFSPNTLGHPDNYIPANPLVTPAHIVPEWYFLPFYAILRAVTFNLNLYLAGAGAAGALLVYQLCWIKTVNPRLKSAQPVLFAALILLGIPGFMIGFLSENAVVAEIIKKIPFSEVSLMPAKLGGVLSMFGAIAMLLLLPFIDRHPVRSARFRPYFRPAVIGLLLVFVVLGVCGSKPAEGLWVPLAQVMTLAYFGFFLALIPWLNNHEPVVKLPVSIHEAVLAASKTVLSTIFLAALLFFPPMASARADDKEVAAPAEQSGQGIAAGQDEHKGTGGTEHAAGNASTSASAHSVVLPKLDWHFAGPFGTYDRAALQRGYQVYKQVCANCHSMKRVAYRNLAALGYNDAQIKAVAAEATMTDGPNDEGEMFERPGRPSDHFKSPYPNDQAAKANNGGALPPDLSLIVKARADGPNYVYGILTGYEPAPAGEELSPTQHWNKYFAAGGFKLSMPPPLVDGAVSYEDGTEGSVSQYAKDVVEFLNWAAEPELEERKRTGVKILIYLAVFASLMYAVKKKIWSNIH